MKDLPAPVIATGRRYYPDKSLERLRGRCLRRGKHTVGYYSRERKVGRDYLVAAACERLEVTSFQGHAASFARREKDRPNARAIIFPVVRSGRYDWSFAGGGPSEPREIVERDSRGKRRLLPPLVIITVTSGIIRNSRFVYATVRGARGGRLLAPLRRSREPRPTEHFAH